MPPAAFDTFSPLLREGYRTLIGRLQSALPRDGMDELHNLYGEYAVLDRFLPRPILTLFGYGASEDEVTKEQLKSLGDLVYLPQLFRDFLAIHDDIVDEDLVKFGEPTLPVSYSAVAREPLVKLQMTKWGKDLALYYGDLVFGFIGEVIAASSAAPAEQAALSAALSRTLQRNQIGQLRELLLQEQPPESIDPDALIEIYRLKAADYCYALPFELGALVSRQPSDLIAGVRSVLLDIGAASQIVDDLAGACPWLLGDEKDSVGEWTQLRRTLLLVLLARSDKIGDDTRRVLRQSSCTPDEAQGLRDALAGADVIEGALVEIERLTQGARRRLDLQPLGTATRNYVSEVLRFRVEDTVEALRGALR
jgi:geranylgeranyl diphosphate synthase type II